MRLSNWLRLLKENDFQVNQWPMVAGASLMSPVNSFFSRLQSTLHWKRAVATERENDPIFIIGHWRTGTTFLEYMLGMDDRMRTPDTYECTTPEHFICSRWIGTRILACPKRRPMDNVPMSWTKPQEDEFALLALGATSVFRHFGFPNRSYDHINSLTLDNVSPRELTTWKDAMHRFVTYLNYVHRKQLILKSPTHTGRIQVLLDMYPNAKFIHVTRNPMEFIPSTFFLWQSLEATSSLQRNVSHIDHEDYVFNCFHKMYDSFESRKHLIPKENFVQVTYEEVTQNTCATIGKIYESLGLMDFQPVKPKIQAHLQAKEEYKANRHVINDRLAARIEDECSNYITQYCKAKKNRHSWSVAA